MKDIVERLRLTDAEREAVAYYLGTGGPHAVHSTLLRLLSRTGSDAAKTADDAAECHSKIEKTPERERITDAEREAIEWASKTLCVGWHDLAAGDKQRTRDAVATLRGLLERLK